MPVLTNIQSLMLKVWQSAAESGELTLSYASENDARRIRTSLYTLRKMLLNAPDTDPALSMTLEDLSIRTHWPSSEEQRQGRKWEIVIFSQASCGAFARTAELLGVSLTSVGVSASLEKFNNALAEPSELSKSERELLPVADPVEVPGFAPVPNKFF